MFHFHEFMGKFSTYMSKKKIKCKHQVIWKITKNITSQQYGSFTPNYHHSKFHQLIADLRLKPKLIVTIQCENFNQEATSSAVRRGCANGDDKLIDLSNINKITIYNSWKLYNNQKYKLSSVRAEQEKHRSHKD